jgi:hypothetical protein
MPDTAKHQPRHLYNTGKFKTLPPNASRHLAADGTKVHTWPTVTDPQPTKALPRPAAHPAPKVTVEPAPRPLSWLHVAMWAAVVVIPLVAAVALVVTS